MGGFESAVAGMVYCIGGFESDAGKYSIDGFEFKGGEDSMSGFESNGSVCGIWFVCDMLLGNVEDCVCGYCVDW